MFYIESCGNKLGRGHIMVCFHPSCVRLLYFLCEYTDFHVNLIECQVIHFHLLLLIFSSFWRLLRFHTLLLTSVLVNRTPPALLITPPAIILFVFHIVYILRRRVIYTGSRGLGLWWGCPYGVEGLHDDDDDYL